MLMLFLITELCNMVIRDFFQKSLFIYVGVNLNISNPFKNALIVNE